MTDLICCPLCGKAPTWKADMYLHQILHCEDCRLEVRADPSIAFVFVRNTDKYEREAIAMIWNNRAPPAPVSREGSE